MPAVGRFGTKRQEGPIRGSSYWTGPITHNILFLVSHFNFLFIPCGRLSWLPVSFLLHVKYTLSYKKVNVKVSWIHIARNRLKGAQAWITRYYLQTTQCLSLPRKRSPDGATSDCGRKHLIAAYYSFIDPERMNG